jgi:hypothetical protein
MSDLHIALLILAGVLLALLFAYNKWTERRMLRRLDASLREGVGDPLMQPAPAGAVRPAPAGSNAQPTSPAAEPVPVSSVVQVTDLPLSALYGGRVEPRLDPLPDEKVQTTAPGEGQSPAAAVNAGATPRWVEDPLLDWVLELRCSHAVDGVTVFDAAAPLARLESGLPLFLVAWDARHQLWVEPDRFGFYTELLVATQLAHRRHKLDEIEASRFIAVVQQVAMALDADFDAPDVKRVVEMAQDLDQLCGRFDVQIGMTLDTTGAPWDAQRVARAAQAARLTAASATRWERLTADGALVFSLRADAYPASRLSLELDVPLAPVAADPLRELFKASDLLAIELGARVIDDNGRPVNAASLAGIAEQLDGLYAEMTAAGIEPGSARARRLYA